MHKVKQTRKRNIFSYDCFFFVTSCDPAGLNSEDPDQDQDPGPEPDEAEAWLPAQGRSQDGSGREAAVSSGLVGQTAVGTVPSDPAHSL